MTVMIWAVRRHRRTARRTLWHRSVRTGEELRTTRSGRFFG